MGKNNGKNISKNLSGKYSQKRLDHAKQSATDALKLLQKNQFKKLLIELQKFQKIHNKIILKQLQMNTIKKYLKKDIYRQKKDQKLLMN